MDLAARLILRLIVALPPTMRGHVIAFFLYRGRPPALFR